MAWYSPWSWFNNSGGPTRTAGIQTSAPKAYSAPSATPVTFDSAMQVSAVWAASRIIAETIASLPFHVYRKTKDGREIAADHPLSIVLTKKPNLYQTDVEFWETMALNLVSSGNAYAVIVRSGGRIVALLPVSSAQVETALLPDGTIVHSYTSGTETRVYSSESMWHVKLFGNGVIGLSPLSYARNSIGIAQAADNRVGAIFSNGAKPSGVLMIDRTLSDDQRTQIRTEFSELEAGNDDRLFVLEAGMKYEQTSMTPQDIELLETRRFQIEDIGRFFGVPSILLNQTFGQSSIGSNVYEILGAFYKINLRPYLEKFEASIMRWLMTDSEQDEYEVEFNFDALLRADTSTRLKSYGEAINTGQMTPNEARRAEGREGLPGGDNLMVQGAMIPITEAGQEGEGNE